MTVERKKMKHFIIGCCVVVATLVGYASGVVRTNYKFAENEKIIEQRTREVIGKDGLVGLHARQAGWLSGFGNYEIVSFDRGKTWWSLSQNRSLISPADCRLTSCPR